MLGLINENTSVNISVLATVFLKKKLRESERKKERNKILVFTKSHSLNSMPLLFSN